MTHEEVVAFGPQDQLQGIVSVPEKPQPGLRRAVVMANVGMHHRVGPFRLYVDLARAMARDGWWALRFDYLGMGESGPRALDNGSVSDETQDLSDAIDFLRSAHGIDEVLLVALCSGVDGAHPIVIQHERVRGAVFIDGYTYRTVGFVLRRYILRGLQLQRWKRFVRRKLRADSAQRDRAPSAAAMFARVYPSRDQFRRDLATLRSRGVRTHFIFTGTADSSFNSERQLSELVGRDLTVDGMAVTRLADADHVFTGVHDRQNVIHLIREWAHRALMPATHG